LNRSRARLPLDVVALLDRAALADSTKLFVREHRCWSVLDGTRGRAGFLDGWDSRLIRLCD